MKFGQLIEYNQINHAGNETERPLQNPISLFYDGLDQLHDVCSFEDIGQSLFHVKLFKCK